MRSPGVASRDKPTVWGHDPISVHDRFWTARGLQPVRLGSDTDIDKEARGYLLTGTDSLVCFDVRPLLRASRRGARGTVTARIHDADPHSCRERIVSDEAGALLRVERSYGARSPAAPVALTGRADDARRWGEATHWSAAWTALLEEKRRRRRRQQPSERHIPGRVYDTRDPWQLSSCLNDIVRFWRRPDVAFPGVRRHSDGVWLEESAKISPDATVVGPLWVGAGRSVEARESLIGPGVLWDATETSVRPAPLFSAPHSSLGGDDRQPSFEPPLQHGSWARSRSKRLFDIAFSLAALGVTLPIYPLVMLVIWKEDGTPFFFAHRRETLGGREFPCLKFRSMRTNAEDVKAFLAQKNEVDGPQFYMQHDPRLTRVGHFIRKTKIDELPQFFNVLAGHMSVVGPRPSPFEENQYCPPWRKARLSVRPGITGLWQINRKRRKDQDFQEWIEYDLEYVENASWKLDTSILCRTVWKVIREFF